MNTVILSYGMGVESTAILVRWISEPTTRPCPLEELIVITAQVGDEYHDTGRDVRNHILPLLRRQAIRYVQVARRGHLETDGITVLDDSRTPGDVYLDGFYKLSDELRRNGTVPQYSGVHRCALKFKAWVIEQWLENNLRGPARHAFGYNADETGRIERSEYAVFERIAFGFNADEQKRIERSCEYNNVSRQAFYPLLEWNWNRKSCLDYLHSVLGVVWKKSACVYCPFNALRDDAIERHRLHPNQVADALALEHVSMALNPRGTLYKRRSLIEITQDAANDAAILEYQRRLHGGNWAVYRVRRIYSAKATADRAVEKLAVFEREEAAGDELRRIAARLARPIEHTRGIPYVWCELRSETSFPTREEFITIAPAVVETKARHGIDRFERKWCSLQLRLFLA
jgi:hypothetical protein